MDKTSNSTLRKTLFAFLLVLAVVPVNFLIFAMVFRPGLLSSMPMDRISVGPSGGNRIVMTNALDGVPRIEAYDTNDNLMMMMGFSPNGISSLRVKSPETGRTVIAIDNGLEGGRPRAALFNPETGLVAWSIQLDESGRPVITDHTAADE